jgi:HD superfamily phosphodiesterase
MSHDSDRFIYMEANGKVYCFDISGQLVRSNPDNLRSAFVQKLRIDAKKYIDEVYKN